MKIMVTGAAGFIGSHIANELAEKGYDVVGVYRTKESSAKSMNKFCAIVEDLSLRIEYDKPVDVIIHTAAKSRNYDISMEDYLLHNIIATTNLVKYATKYKVRKIIFLSSISVYGKINEIIINELTNIINPGNYGLSKYIGEKLLEDAKSISSIALRLPGVLGKGAVNPWLAKVAMSLKEDKIVEIHNPKEKFNNMIHVSDLEIFIEELIKRDWKGFEICTLGAVDSMTIEEIVEYFKRNINSNSELKVKESNDISFRISSQKAVELGYNPISVKETILKYCQDIL